MENKKWTRTRASCQKYDLPSGVMHRRQPAGSGGALEKHFMTNHDADYRGTYVLGIQFRKRLQGHLLECRRTATRFVSDVNIDLASD